MIFNVSFRKKKQMYYIDRTVVHDSLKIRFKYCLNKQYLSHTFLRIITTLLFDIILQMQKLVLGYKGYNGLYRLKTGLIMKKTTIKCVYNQC